MTAPASFADLEGRVLRLLADMLNRPVAVRSVAHMGYRSDWTGVVVVDGGTDSIFIKARTGTPTTSALDHERAVLQHLPAGIGPSVRGWCYSPEDEVAILALADLSANRWPPPWSAARISQTVDLLNRIAAVGLDIDAMPRLVDTCSRLGNWMTIAADPAPFLAVGLRSGRWLERILPSLLDMEFAECLGGNQLVHLDVRSDNICFGPAGPVLLDWEYACVGNPRIDLLSWLPSLQMEGGPKPWRLVPDAELRLVAFLAGYWSSQAGLPEPAGAPGLRRLQRAQAAVALDWLDILGRSPR